SSMSSDLLLTLIACCMSVSSTFFFFFFFFQAEDGIRDGHVTGVQTCALPICCLFSRTLTGAAPPVGAAGSSHPPGGCRRRPRTRSEERRVGKECRSRGAPYH